jgi:hypothetical protein
MSESEVLTTLGKPTSRASNSLFYFHEHKELIHNEPYDSDNSIVLILRDGAVWALEVWKTTQS